MVNTDANQVAAIARLFSASVIQEMARKGNSPLFIRLAHESSILEHFKLTSKVYDFFDVAYSILKKKSNRHEYVYKSALTQKILLGRHSLKTAAMLTEFRVGKCKADVAILNGTATVYEIKSERDSLSRLEKQICNYRDVFAKVYVIAGENHIPDVLAAVPTDVGILKLSSRHSISEIRSAKDLPERTLPAAIFDSIQLNEAKKILAMNDILIPDVPNTEIYSALKEQFVKLPPQKAHISMVEVLKKTRDLQPLENVIEQLPASLQSAALSTSLKKRDLNRFLGAVHTPLYDALKWGQ